MNKEEIKERVSLFDLCKQYGIKVKNNTIKCPFHDDKHPSCSIYNNGKNYHCFSCGASGDIFKFVMNMEDIPFFEAFKKLGGNCKDFDKYKFEEKRKKRRANEIVVLLDCILAEATIRRKAKALKRLEKEMFAINPKMTSKPLWSDYLDDNGNELMPVPPLIASYVYESFSIEKRYQALDEMFIHYEKQGYRVCGYSSKHIYPLIDEYLNICKAKLADMKRLDNVILKYVSQ